MGKLAKDAGDDDDTDALAAASTLAGTIDLSTLDALVDATPEQIAKIMAETGAKALAQLGVYNNSDLVGQVDETAGAYAKERGAEMVGKKWVDGELVDNPDAQWVITDATRDDIQDILGQVFSGDMSADDARQAIMDAGSFSADRAELIARTELNRANSLGALTGYKTARDGGVEVKKLWQADDGACDDCLSNEDDGAIDLDDTFSTGDDAPPAHPNCECALIPITSGQPEFDNDDENDDDD